MLSSTSSSNERIPVANWGRIWIQGLVLFLLMIVGWECFWRARGFFRTPAPQSIDKWSLTRENASRGGKKAVALIGSSRILTDIDSEVFASQTGVKPAQLGISGGSPLPVLQSLAEDRSFQGTVICDFHEVFVYAPKVQNPSEKELSAEDFLKAYKERTFLEDLLPAAVETQGKHILKDTFVFQMPELSLSTILHSVARRKLPPPTEVPGIVVREGIIVNLEDLREDEIERLRKISEEKTLKQIQDGKMPVDEVPKVFEKIQHMVTQIQSRGGQVIFVCLPMSGKVWELNQAYFPKKQYWDVFASHTTARTIHFMDVPALSGYQCYDGSHLNRNDATTFTKSLTEILYDDNK